MHYVSLGKKITKFKTLSNNKYIKFNLENLIYCINYNLLENNQIIVIYIYIYIYCHKYDTCQLI